MPYPDQSKKSEYDKVYRTTSTGKQVIARKKKAQVERCRETIRQLKNVPCVDCGVRYPPCVMDFDHRDPAQKRCEVSNIRSINSIKLEADKCDVVCANCHRLRSFKGKESAISSDI